MSHLFQVDIRRGSPDIVMSEVLSTLEGLLPVKFTLAGQRRLEGVGEMIVGERAGGTSCDGSGVASSLSVPPNENSAQASVLKDVTVVFADDPQVPFPFRGKSLRNRIGCAVNALKVIGGEKVLASGEAGPLWTLSTMGDAKHFRSAFPLPRFGPEGGLKDVLNEERFVEILPLLHWLRDLCAPASYASPPLRACFMFDDPNLHWQRYGYVDFKQIATNAAKENYHVSFATIPLDCWFTHMRTAALFRTSSKYLSLAIHGNNHTRKELARNYTKPERLCLLNQAVRRIERLERSTALKVCRVMVPPHGACSEEMLGELPACGFEAACLSHGSLRAHNATKAWTKSVGYLPAEQVQNCPVLPRWGLSGNTTNAILLAAFLGQPLVLRGHQRDLKNGIELLDQHAGYINSLGSVLWSNMTGVSRSNYLWRMDGETCRLKPLSRNVEFHLPSGASQLIVESPFDGLTEPWHIVDGGSKAELTVLSGQGVALPKMVNRTISVRMLSSQPDRIGGSLNPLVIPFFRRLLTEGRD